MNVYTLYVDLFTAHLQLVSFAAAHSGYVYIIHISNSNISVGVISADDLPSGFDEEQESTFIERLGAGTDKLLAEFFCWWGTGTDESSISDLITARYGSFALSGVSYFFQRALHDHGSFCSSVSYSSSL